MRVTFFVLLMTTLITPFCAGQPVSRGAFVEEISNERSSFAVRVNVNHADRIYAKDDLLQATVESSEDGYLYLLYRDASGNVSVLFPNKFQKDNFIRKNNAAVVPATESNFKIRIDAPFGEEMLKAVISQKPLTYMDNMMFSQSAATPVNEETAKSFSKSFSKETPDWAEHQVNIQTTESRSSNENNGNNHNGGNTGNNTETGKRFAVSIGISDFKDSNINNLGICHVDAQKMLELFTSRCGVAKDNSLLLTNDKATLDNIRKIMKETLPSITKPGDTVFLFWSGHGGRTNDEKHEFLVPYDADTNNINGSMLFDETFGRWIQDLDGRKVLIVLDACHSGGQANSAKNLSKALDTNGDWKPLRFAFTQLAVAKDVGQKNAALIASSTSSEVSYVRKEKDMSVLTYYLLNAVENSNSPITHVKWCDSVR
ncbi:MAG: caspase family protein, partial [Planctomycetaceae bacterium]|nr:caspase family protein [Planctomycetaceae bacterium]